MNKKKFLAIVFIVIVVLTVFALSIRTSERRNTGHIENVNTNTEEMLDEEDISKYSEDYRNWLELPEEEKVKIAVIPQKYDVPLDIIYKRIEQEKNKNNIYNLIVGSTLDGELPTSYILLGEDTNKDGVADENDIKVDSYGGISIKVEDQLGSSLCWAFASMNCLETNLVLNCNVEYDFSERHLDYLQSDILSDSIRAQNNGGNFGNFKNYITLGDGPVLETEVPFESEYSNIEDYEYLQGLLQKTKVNEENFIEMPSMNKDTTEYTDEELLTFRTLVKEHIIKNGSLEASIYADGIHNSIDKKFEVLNYQGDHIANHSISIIGWDDNFSKDNFIESCRPNNDGAYIALNSYGEDWGNCGIFYISYEDVLVEKRMHGVSNAYVLDVLDIYVEGEPYKINYCSGEYFNAEGMVVKAKYQNGEEKEITDYTISPQMILDDTEYVTISYTEGNSTQTTTQRINVYSNTEDLGNGIKLYYDTTDKIISISGSGNPTIDFEKYDLNKIILGNGIKGITPVNVNNLIGLNSIYILDSEFALNDNFITNDSVKIYCYKNSIAEEYCETNNIVHFSYDNLYKCGKNTYAFLNKTDEKMIISGTGEINEYKINQIPWKTENEYIIEVEIENEITNISNKLFGNNASIKKVNIGNDVITIGQNAFYNCIGLEEIVLNEKLQKVEKAAFYGCTNLQQINIPDNVLEIGEYCFYNCTKLESVELSSKMYLIKGYTFYNCSSLKTITLPDIIISIGNNSFQNCTSLEKIKMSKDLQSISNWTFANCTNLKEIDFSECEKLGRIGDATFNGCSSLESFIMPDTIKKISQGVFGKCISLKTLQFSHGLTRLWNGVAQNCSALEELSLPYGIKMIGDRNFLGDTNLQKVTLPCSLESIGNMNFSRCNKLQYVVIPDSLIIDESISLLGECQSNPTIYCKSGSSIQEYAVKQGINIEIDDIEPTLEIQQEGNKVTAIAYDDNEVVGLSDYPYSFDGGINWQAEPYIEISNEDIIITVCARDAVGNITTQSIKVREKALTGIEITTPPSKTDYIEGQDFATTGMVVTATYNNGETKETKEVTNYTVVEGNNLTVKKTSVKISYTEDGITKTATQNITVKEKELTGIEITTAPSKTDYIAGQNFVTTRMVVTATYNNGETKEVTDYTVVDGNNLPVGKTSVGIVYSEGGIIKATTQSITVREKELTGIEITTAPSKTDYIEGQDFVAEGMVVTATYNDGETKEVAYYTVIDGENLTLEITSVTISYTEDAITKTATQSITVREKELTGIEITAAPSKTDYIEGQDFVAAGMVVTATYNNGETKEVSDYTVVDGNNLTVEKTSVTIKYTEEGITKTASQSITVREKELTGIEITTAPSKTDYIEGQDFVAEGMVVTATYNDGETKEVTDYTVVDGNNLTVETTSLTISYTEGGITKTATQSITVEEQLRIDLGDYEERIFDDTRYMFNISPETTKEDLELKINTNGNVEVYKGAEIVTNKDANIGTGMKIKIKLNGQEKEYTVVIKGDINGDGKVKLTDLSKLKFVLIGTTKVEGAYKEASDLNGDGKVKISDLSKMKLYLVRKISSL